MLEYFGFYEPAPAPETEPTAFDEPQRELAVARGARLADRCHHTPSPAHAAPAWESGTRER